MNWWEIQSARMEAEVWRQILGDFFMWPGYRERLENGDCEA